MINRIIIDNQEAITLENGNNSATIIKSLGGTVYTVNLNGSEVLFGDSEDELTTNDLFRGRILFPYNDRIPDGKYSFNGKEYQFPLNCGKDSIHGLIYNRDMEVVSEKDGDSVSVTLKTTINNGEFDGYPFDIAIELEYLLTKEDFQMNIEVSNPGNEDAPFALGWHPYFTFGKNIDSSNLKFGSKEYYDVNEELYYEGNHYSVKGTDLDFTEGLDIGSRELDIAISLSDKADFELKDGNNVITLSFTKKMFPVLQLFIPEDRKSIAVEPISAPSDTFNYPETGLKVLKPGESEKANIKLSCYTV